MELKATIIKALRFGAASASALDSEIDRTIRTARAEMIRLGISAIIADSSHELIEDAIVTFAQMKMGKAALYEQFKESWEFQVDNIRKSNIIHNDEVQENV